MELASRSTHTRSFDSLHALHFIGSRKPQHYNNSIPRQTHVAHKHQINHRSNAGSSAQESGLWYTAAYPEQAWIRDWVSVQEWLHGIQQTLGAPDTITVNTFGLI